MLIVWPRIHVAEIVGALRHELLHSEMQLRSEALPAHPPWCPAAHVICVVKCAYRMKYTLSSWGTMARTAEGRWMHSLLELADQIDTLRIMHVGLMALLLPFLLPHTAAALLSTHQRHQTC